MSSHTPNGTLNPHHRTPNKGTYPIGPLQNPTGGPPTPQDPQASTATKEPPLYLYVVVQYLQPGGVTNPPLQKETPPEGPPRYRSIGKSHGWGRPYLAPTACYGLTRILLSIKRRGSQGRVESPSPGGPFTHFSTEFMTNPFPTV